MSETVARATWTSRWRMIYDVLIGVVLFLSLLVPAIRQASTGTPSGLRNAMLLLLLDVVVLVMLSRYITRPDRHASRSAAERRTASRSEDPEFVLSPQEAVVVLDHRGAPLPALGLTLTGEEIVVRQGSEESAPTARLAWTDCAAVVTSQLTIPNGSTFWYLQFVATHEERIQRPHDLRHARGVAVLLGGLTGTAATMVWPVSSPMRHVPALVLDHIERNHPAIRIVRPETGPETG